MVLDEAYWYEDTDRPLVDNSHFEIYVAGSQDDVEDIVSEDDSSLNSEDEDDSELHNEVESENSPPSADDEGYTEDTEECEDDSSHQQQPSGFLLQTTSTDKGASNLTRLEENQTDQSWLSAETSELLTSMGPVIDWINSESVESLFDGAETARTL